ncbi:MAG: ATP/cobalamin adenosyltransferase [Candidatus Peregrinibacteria bacterium GW2011_GWF2_33_10]|nr:MAG: ATP/cobalamin adenosyltransferase [Candidatus Peregrinibacteria bacterium GW2011_GWF2_33_10]OGJ45175.1 MAG: ATP:cob(I)alamin adenosyltransferase [Candidatus Peregrinibacteria bacterium RIFOXYA2_FULL_33_21]OGJ45996.1 MAG: ATP:cob(I)alamin adenosyltransferase [Candidatus Peregrinibacteria bacterium RIFOXYA12_FULL_33_12]OGJ50885.1 MAG: ATP:cob(I)alamin adenosyltransferase [Candidatus Peregrinibacteria bacterium RIFOXYB2_FULL_33_20]
MKIYTKTGDQGQTSLFGGKRVSKDDLRVECYGTVDELNSFLGLAKSFLDKNSLIQKKLENLQNDLLRLGSDLATPLEQKNLNIKRIDIEDVENLEKWIDEMDKILKPLNKFILPGGSSAESAIHCARSICRKAERRLVTLMRTEKINDQALKYLNRLSDALFTLARFLGKN